MTAPETVNTHGVLMEFGKHTGERITRVPLSYLKWMANTSTNEKWRGLAKAELERRGSSLPSIELSAHAIDNASLRALDLWHRFSNTGEGLHSWLQRMVLEALEKGERSEGDRIAYRGMILVIVEGEEFPVLKTVFVK